MTDERAGEPDSGAEPEGEDEPDSGAGVDSPADGVDDSRAGGGVDSPTEQSERTAKPDETTAAPDEVAAYTTDERTLDSRVRWLWIGRALLIGLVVGGVATAVAFGVDRSWLWVGPVVGVFIAGLGVTHSILLYRTWSYEVREDSLFLDRGVITRVQTVVPYVRVQHIDTSRGPIERSVGLSTLVVYTAGSRGADVTIPGLTPPEADDLQTRLKRLAIESEGEDAV